MPVVTSSVPIAIDALVYTVANLPAFAGIQVVDGWAGPNQEKDLIAIAYGDKAAAGGQSSRYAGSARRTDEYDIACLISCWVGGYRNAQQAEARTRAFGLLAALETAIRPVGGVPAPATLPDSAGNPTVLYGQITDVDYKATDNVEASAGRFAQIDFAVHVLKVI